MSSGRRSGRTVFIEDEAAYAQGRERAIMRNARKGRGARWLAEDSTRQAVIDFLRQHNGAPGFLGKMAESFEQWYSLTAGQEAAVRKIMADRAERKAAAIARDAGSQHVGTVGERLDLSLTCGHVHAFETEFGTTRLYICRDASGNVCVLKASRALYCGKVQLIKGDAFTVRATVKKHDVRQGVAQTLLNRAEVRSIAAPAPQAAQDDAPRKIEGYHVIALRPNGTTDYFPELFATRPEGEAMQARLANGEFGNWADGAPLDTVAQWSKA